jgi:hypothetical protein
MFNQTKLQAEESPIMRDILTPGEIAKFWTYVKTPGFGEGGILYLARRWKLKFRIYADICEDLSFHWRLSEKMEAVREIQRLGLTHVHKVELSRIYIIDPYGRRYYTSYVSGATVKS